MYYVWSSVFKHEPSARDREIWRPLHLYTIEDIFYCIVLYCTVLYFII